MYSKLKIYHFYTPLPLILLLAGAYVFRHGIINTLANNPHPQINYAIFALIVVGAVLILVTLRKVMAEAAKLAEYAAAVKRGDDPAQLQAIALAGDADVSYVLRMMAGSAGRALTHREQVAIEHELVKAENRLSNRHTLPQHITNLLVGMGLLGTFIGLLATLGDIAALISSFSTLDVNSANPIDVFRVLVERMKAPMYSMGIAFSASLYGLLGSIVLGFMMVSIRRCMQDVVSLLGSEVAQHIEFSLSRESAFADQLDGSGAAAAANAANPVIPGGALRQPDDIRILQRIEERLAHSSRIQESALKNEIEQFAKQRADFMRTIAEHATALGHFQTELKRLGTELGGVSGALERGNADLAARLQEQFADLIRSAGDRERNLTQVADLMTRMADDSALSRQLLGALIERDGAGGRQASNAELAKMIQTAFEKSTEQILHKRGFNSA